MNSKIQTVSSKIAIHFNYIVCFVDVHFCLEGCDYTQSSIEFNIKDNQPFEAIRQFPSGGQIKVIVQLDCQFTEDDNTETQSQVAPLQSSISCAGVYVDNTYYADGMTCTRDPARSNS